MFIIKLKDGFARKDVFEGWIGTIISKNATQFKTREFAELILTKKYTSPKWGGSEIVELPHSPIDDMTYSPNMAMGWMKDGL